MYVFWNNILLLFDIVFVGYTLICAARYVYIQSDIVLHFMNVLQCIYLFILFSIFPVLITTDILNLLLSVS